MLKKWNASAFHATDFYPGGGEFERKTRYRKQLYQEHSQFIPTHVADHISKSVVCAFRPSEFVAIAPEKWRQQFGTNTHAIAAQICIMYLGWWRQEVCPSEEFAYFQESGDEDEVRVEEVVSRIRQADGYKEIAKIQSFSTLDKGRARGLEAADFLAWQCNKHYIDKFITGEHIPRKDFAAFLRIANENKFSFLFLTGQHLKDFFSKTAKPAITS